MDKIATTDEESKIDALEVYILATLAENDPTGIFTGTQLRKNINTELGENFTYGQIGEALYRLEMAHRIVGRKLCGVGDTYFRLSDEYKKGEGLQ